MDKLNKVESLIVNYLNGTISGSEYQQLKIWINLSEENQLEFDRIREVWLASNLADKSLQFDSRAAFDRFQKVTSVQATTPMLRKAKRIVLSYPWAAAILIFALSGGVALRHFVRSSVDGQVSVAYQEIIVPNRSRSKVQLHDSSVITINAATTLRYDTDFGKKQRNIWLDGETYFVVHKAPIPFVVHSGTVQIKAVGTECNVRGYSSENQIE